MSNPLKAVDEPDFETREIDRKGNVVVGWILSILGLIVIFVMTWDVSPKHASVTLDNAVLYTSLDVIDQVFDTVMNSPEMWTVNRGLANNPVRDQLLPAYQPMMKRVTERVLQRFENSGTIIRVRSGTTCVILGKAKDPMTGEPLYKVKLTSSRYSGETGYFHRSVLSEK